MKEQCNYGLRGSGPELDVNSGGQWVLFLEEEITLVQSYPKRETVINVPELSDDELVIKVSRD